MVSREDRGDEITTLPASGVPTDFELEQEEALDKAAESELANTRKLAENWRNGLAGLLALVATIFFIKGRESVFDISQGWRLALAAALVVALAAAVWGAWQAMKGAFGSPSAIDWDDILQEGGWSSYQTSLAESAATHVRRAQGATVVALVALAVGVLLSWFAPKPSSPTFIQVTAAGNVVTCSEFKGISNGAMQLAEAEPISLTDVVSFSVVEEC